MYSRSARGKENFAYSCVASRKKLFLVFIIHKSQGFSEVALAAFSIFKQYYWILGKVGMDWIPSLSTSIKIWIIGGKIHCWVRSTNFLFSKVCWQRPAMFYHYPSLPMIWIFTEGEGDGIESRLPFKIVSTLKTFWNCLQRE